MLFPYTPAFYVQYNLDRFVDIKTQIKDAEYYLLRGELYLLKSEGQEGINLFEQAVQLDPSNPQLFYRQGLSLFEYANETRSEKAIFLAIKKLRKAVHLDPTLIDAMHVLGNALCQIGKKQNREGYFLEAEKNYQNALALSENQKYDALADLYWDYGNVWLCIFKNSGEVYDLQKALSAYQKASTHIELLSAEFWLDFGKANLEFAQLMHDVRHCVKAIGCFKHVVTKDSPCFEGWCFLAKSLKTLYEHTHEEDHFTQAVEFFESALQIKTYDADLWIEYIRMLCDSGRAQRDIKRIRTCIEKCHRGYAYHSNHPVILSIWAEALALLGELSDRADLIFEAQNKLSEALNITEEDPAIWYSSGMCMRSFGSYFNDYDYHYQAIQKFQIGLSIDRTEHRLWHALALSYFTVAQFSLDLKEIEKTLKFFQKAIDLYPSSFYLIDHAKALVKFGEATHNKDYLQGALDRFENALNAQKNALYLHPDWLFYYASTLDLLGDFHEEDIYYNRAVEIFSHVLMIDPDYPNIHHRLAQTFCHLGDLIGEGDHFFRAIHHLRLALKHDEENDQIIMDWGLALINIAEHANHPHDSELIFKEAEHKLMTSAKLGNLQAYYHLGCLYSIQRQYDKAMYFIQKADAYKALPPMDEILQDEWLDGLRSTEDFREFLSHLEKSN